MASLTMAEIRQTCKVQTNDELKTKAQNALWYAQVGRTVTFIAGTGLAAGACLTATPVIGTAGVIVGLAVVVFAHTADRFISLARELNKTVAYLVDRAPSDEENVLQDPQLIQSAINCQVLFQIAQVEVYLPVPDLKDIPYLSVFFNNLGATPEPVHCPEEPSSGVPSVGLTAGQLMALTGTSLVAQPSGAAGGPPPSTSHYHFQPYS